MTYARVLVSENKAVDPKGHCASILCVSLLGCIILSYERDIGIMGNACPAKIIAKTMQRI